MNLGGFAEGPGDDSRSALLADLFVFGGFAVGLIVPPVVILWMTFT
jgi:hypothetical protein